MDLKNHDTNQSSIIQQLIIPCVGSSYLCSPSALPDWMSFGSYNVQVHFHDKMDSERYWQAYKLRDVLKWRTVSTLAKGGLCFTWRSKNSMLSLRLYDDVLPAKDFVSSAFNQYY